MSNFTIFADKDMKLLLEPFLPGVTEQIVPIMYRAWTPDIFLLLFRTSGKDGKEYFFVSLEVDYIANSQEIEHIVSSWLGVKIDEFIWPVNSSDDNEEPSVKTSGPYKAFLIRVGSPKDLGYWSDHIVVTSHDNLDEELADFTKKQRSHVEKILKKNPNYTISIYKSEDKTMELFFNGKV